MKRLILILALAGSPFLAACHPPVTIVTEPGKAAYRADQVLLRLQEISNVVKADTGTQPSNVRPRDAFTIIEWISGDDKATPPTTGISQIVASTSSQSWKAAAALSWQSRIRPIFVGYPKLAPYADIIDALLEVL